jgi:hypothetical protein
LERSFILFGSYILQAASSLVFLLLFLSLKREIQRLRSRLERQDVTERLDAMNARLEDTEQRTAAPITPAPQLRPSLNLSKRSQVNRLFKRGEPVETIAATLGLPRREVELLLKVHRAAQAAAAGSTN